MRKLAFLIFILLLAGVPGRAQQMDSLQDIKDTATPARDNRPTVALVDSIPAPLQPPVAKSRPFILTKIMSENYLLANAGPPVSFIQHRRVVASRDMVFYSLAALVLFFAILKFVFGRYFANMFRVFFNTSLRQSQLTDQLLQARLPSMLFNFFFVLAGGWYVYLLLRILGLLGNYAHWRVVVLAATGVLLTYLAKFLILKFTGWITGYRQEADTYIFIVFLINKIVAICLLPLLIIMAFSDRSLSAIALVLSYLLIGLMLLMRFIRSYGLLQHRLKVSRFHFFIYITGIEIIPLLVIYKLALLFITKKL